MYERTFVRLVRTQKIWAFRFGHRHMRAVHKGKIARRPEPNINIQYLYIKCELSVLLSFCHSRRNPDIVLVVLALSLFERAQDVRMYGVVPWWNGAWSGMLERERDLSRTPEVEW